MATGIKKRIKHISSVSVCMNKLTPMILLKGMKNVDGMHWSQRETLS